MYLLSLFRKAPACSSMDRHVGEPIYAGRVVVIDLEIRSEEGISYNTCRFWPFLSQLRIQHWAYEVS